jgi:hypothetical protein
VGYSDYDFKFAKTILRQHFPHLMDEIEAAINELPSKLKAQGISLGRGFRPTPLKCWKTCSPRKNGSASSQ